MNIITIEVSGLTYWEAKELAELLKEVDGVTSTTVPRRTRDSAYDVNSFALVILDVKASAEAHKILVEFSLYLAANYVSGGVKEMGKEHYIALKKRLLMKLGQWRESKEPEKRERIVFLFDDEGELVTKESDDRL